MMTPTFTLTDATGKEIIQKKNPFHIKTFYDFELDKESVVYPLELSNNEIKGVLTITKETTADEWREYADYVKMCC